MTRLTRRLSVADPSSCLKPFHLPRTKTWCGVKVNISPSSCENMMSSGTARVYWPVDAPVTDSNLISRHLSVADPSRCLKTFHHPRTKTWWVEFVLSSQKVKSHAALQYSMSNHMMVALIGLVCGTGLKTCLVQKTRLRSTSLLPSSSNRTKTRRDDGMEQVEFCCFGAVCFVCSFSIVCIV